MLAVAGVVGCGQGARMSEPQTPARIVYDSRHPEASPLTKEQRKRMFDMHHEECRAGYFSMKPHFIVYEVDGCYSFVDMFVPSEKKAHMTEAQVRRLKRRVPINPS